MRLDWIKERAGQSFFRLVFLPGLINPTDFFTKILLVYRHIAALPFLHGTPYHSHPPPLFLLPPPSQTSQSPRCSPRQGPTYLSLPLTQPHLVYLSPPPCQLVTLLASLRYPPVLLPHLPPLRREHNAPDHPSPAAGCWFQTFFVSCIILAFALA
jgi:hypothetical protein